MGVGVWWRNKPILQVIEAVLAPYVPYVRWQIDTGVDTLLGELAPRPMIGAVSRAVEAV